MITILLGILFVCLIFGFPMFTGMVIGPLIAMEKYFSTVDSSLIIQQLSVGISSFVLLAVPMFIFAAEIMCAGEAADRLLSMIRSFVGHLKGGLAITAAGTCAFFGSISGSAQATFVAVGRPMQREMERAGYPVHHSLALLMSAANIAWLIPPSICMIFYAVIAGVSVAELFAAGVIPGILIFLVFSIYEYFIVNKRNIQMQPCATWQERWICFKRALLPMGFPVIILGGIYTGIFSPTEASAVSVLYAFILEKFIFKSIAWKDLPKIALSTGLVTATVFILIAAGQVFSWVITFAGIPQQIMTFMLNNNLSSYAVLGIISLAFLVCCMFMDSLPVIIILTPIFLPAALKAGINPVHLGIVVTVQAALGSITPPFGCNLFTAMAVFEKPFTTVVKGIMPYILLFFITTLLLIFIPEISLFSSRLLF